MSGMTNTRRTMGLLVLAMAAVLLASMLGSSEAGAKKEKINVVQCVVNRLDCRGTDGRDHLVGTELDDFMIGGSGSDILEANGGDDTMQGGPGSDTYTGYVGNFGSDFIKEAGGESDLLDLSSFRSADFSFVPGEIPTDLILDGPGSNEIELDNQFTGPGRIEKIKFADKTLNGKQIKKLAGEAAAKEQTNPEERRGERPPEAENSIQEKEQRS